MSLYLAAYDGPAGPMLADWSPVAEGVQMTTGEHGGQALQAFIPATLDESFRWYDRRGLPHVELGAHGVPVWTGRLEDVAIVPRGIQITALGYWRAFSDTLYTALWSKSTVADFRPLLKTERTGREESQFVFDTNNRLNIAPKKGEAYASGDVGELVYESPHSGARLITTVIFTYELLASSSWEARLTGFTDDFVTGNNLWSLAGNGSTQTGIATLVTLAIPRPTIGFELRTTAGLTYSGETGDTRFRITDLRIKTTTGDANGQAIATDLLASVVDANPTQISASTALIEDQGIDLYDEVYEDAYPADILTRIARLGDTETPPRQWEVGVDEGQRLYLRPHGSRARAWYVDVSEPELQRTLDQLRNSVYATYQNAAGRTLRSDPGINTQSVARYGVTRQAALSASTTDDAQAEVQRDAYLADHSDLLPRAGLTVNAIYDAAGGRWPLWSVRSGDTVTIRNLPPTLSPDIDRIRTMRIAETTYSVDDDTLAITPESPLPSLETLLVRHEERL